MKKPFTFNFPNIELPRIELPRFELPKIKLPRFLSNELQIAKLRIGDCVAEVPIVQGGMGVGISLSGLASAVADQGGIGVIAANAIGMIEPDYYTNAREANIRALRKEIRKARAQTDGIIGVNIMVALDNFGDMLQVAMEERIDVAFLGAGLPLKGIPMDGLRAAGVKLVPIVSSGRAATLIFRYWEKTYGTVPDAVVVEGPMAGGHLGFKPEEVDDPAFALENILPQVIEAVAPFSESFDREIPVIAAGGIYTGEDIYKYLNLGASGVQMASRFVATQECDADIRFKEAYVACGPDDLMLIKSPVGLPGRAIRNHFLEEVTSGVRQSFRCPHRCLHSCRARQANYCISEVLNNARQGELDRGYAFAGSNTWRIERIMPVGELISELKDGYARVARQNTVRLRDEFNRRLERLNALYDEYGLVLEKGIHSVRDEMGRAMERGLAAIGDEHRHTLERINQLKEEYAGQLEAAETLWLQLARFFDTSALLSPAPNQST